MPATENDMEKRIMLGLKNSETRAFDEAYRLYSGKLYHFAFSFLKNRADAEGIVQEVFLRVWENREKINVSRSFKAFLFTIGYNLTIDRFRERVKQREYVNFLRKNASGFESETGNRVDFNNLDELYRKAVELLPPRQRMIYKMHRFDGLTYAGIAGELQISVKTVENHMAGALKFLRKKIGPDVLIEI